MYDIRWYINTFVCSFAIISHEYINYNLNEYRVISYNHYTLYTNGKIHFMSFVQYIIFRDRVIHMTSQRFAF